MSLTDALLAALLLTVAVGAIAIVIAVTRAGSAAASDIGSMLAADSDAATRAIADSTEPVVSALAELAGTQRADLAVLRDVVAAADEGRAADAAAARDVLAVLLEAVRTLVARSGDEAAPRGERVAVTTKSGETFTGVLVHEDEHRLVLEDAALASVDGEKAIGGRQHFRSAEVKWVQERGA